MENCYFQLRKLTRKPHLTWQLSESLLSLEVHQFVTEQRYPEDTLFTLTSNSVSNYPGICLGSEASWKWTYELQPIHPWGWGMYENYETFGSGTKKTQIQKSQKRIHSSWAKKGYCSVSQTPQWSLRVKSGKVAVSALFLYLKWA